MQRRNIYRKINAKNCSLMNSNIQDNPYNQPNPNMENQFTDSNILCINDFSTQNQSSEINATIKLNVQLTLTTMKENINQQRPHNASINSNINSKSSLSTQINWKPDMNGSDMVICNEDEFFTENENHNNTYNDLKSNYHPNHFANSGYMNSNSSDITMLNSAFNANHQVFQPVCNQTTTVFGNINNTQLNTQRDSRLSCFNNSFNHSSLNQIEHRISLRSQKNLIIAKQFKVR